MSSFVPSISPLHPTEGIGQGVISDIFQRQTQSSRTTSIHILDDDSLLNIFYLYRPTVTVIDEDENFDEVRHGISITSGGWDREPWWYKFAEDGGTSYLADILAHSPPLPLVIDYLDGDRNITAEDGEGIFLSLEQPDRIRCIRVG